MEGGTPGRPSSRDVGRNWVIYGVVLVTVERGFAFCVYISALASNSLSANRVLIVWDTETIIINLAKSKRVVLFHE